MVLSIFEWVENILVNDESSSDKELVELFTSEGITQHNALAFVAQRDKALTDFKFKLAVV